MKHILNLEELSWKLACTGDFYVIKTLLANKNIELSLANWYQTCIFLLFPSDICLFSYQKLSVILHFTDTKFPLSNMQWDHLILFSVWTVVYKDRSKSRWACLKLWKSLCSWRSGRGKLHLSVSLHILI